MSSSLSLPHFLSFSLSTFAFPSKISLRCLISYCCRPCGAPLAVGCMPQSAPCGRLTVELALCQSKWHVSMSLVLLPSLTPSLPSPAGAAASVCRSSFVIFHTECWQRANADAKYKGKHFAIAIGTARIITRGQNQQLQQQLLQQPQAQQQQHQQQAHKKSLQICQTMQIAGHDVAKTSH